MLAACLSLVDRLRESDRVSYGLNKEQIASQLFEAERREIADHLQATCGALRVCEAMNRALEKGEAIPPTIKIELGLSGLRVPANAPEIMQYHVTSLDRIRQAVAEATRERERNHDGE